MVRLFPEEFRTAGLRVLFDLSFFIIVTTISLNIVFGIIVDSFTELRDEKVGYLNQEAYKILFPYTCHLL